MTYNITINVKYSPIIEGYGSPAFRKYYRAFLGRSQR